MDTGALVVGVLSLVASTVAAIYATRSQRRASDQSLGAQLVEEALGQMREQLRAQDVRIVALEAETASLRAGVASRDRIVRALATFVDRVGVWIAGGMCGPKPEPPDVLAAYIDTTLWPHGDSPEPLALGEPPTREN